MRVNSFYLELGYHNKAITISNILIIINILTTKVMEAKQVLSGPISSSNVGEEFIRVDEIAPADEFGFLNRKTGFLAIAEGSFEKAIEAIKSGKRQVKLGSRNQRSGVYNVTLVNPDVTVDAPGAAANADVTLTHTA